MKNWLYFMTEKGNREVCLNLNSICEMHFNQASSMRDDVLAVTFNNGIQEEYVGLYNARWMEKPDIVYWTPSDKTNTGFRKVFLDEEDEDEN